MNILKISQNQIYFILCVLANLIFFFSRPYIACDFVPNSALITLAGSMAFIGFSILALPYLYIDKWSKIIGICMMSTLVHAILIMIFYYDEFGLEAVIVLVGKEIRYLLFPFIIILLKNHFKRFLYILWYINIIIVILSIILFILSFSGIYLPYVEFSPDGRPHYFFYIGATNVLLEFGERIFIRIAGFCDEPGQFALMLTHLIVLNEFTLKNKYYRIILSIAGLLTFSVAFFITYVPILFYWVKAKILNVKSILNMIIILAMGLFFFYKTVNVLDKESIDIAIETMITNRFEQDSDGKFQGDNRSSSIKYQFDAFLESPLIGVRGKGGAFAQSHNLADLTLVTDLALNGILFTFLYYLPFIYLIYIYRNKKEFFLLCAIGLNYLQRPGIEPSFFLLVLTLMYYSRFYISTHER